ncbi:MAG TPA: V-type ATPase subunit [Candidatus Dormibacteraeota bacterium]|nr:V-type ATPase subunit [Candidatus Dormibacteraeota bacterium]
MAGELRRYAAANARVRTLLAGLLGRAGLETLYGYPTVEALLDALARTPYAPLAGAASVSERGLLDRLAAVGRAVLATLADPERAFLHQLLLRHEVDNLKIVIRAVHRRLAWEEITSRLAPLPGIATVDPQRLATARDLRELADLLADSPYGRALRAAIAAVDRVGSFAAEIAIELDYYERLWAAVDTLQTADAARARALLGVVFDLLNLSWIARYRDALGLSPEEILNYTLRQGRWITTDLRRELAENPRTPWAAALARTPYGELLAGADVRGFDAAVARLWRYLARQVQRMLASYPFHIGVPLGFVLVQEIEIRDLRVLLAAKGLGVPPAEAFDRLATVRH